MVWIQIKTLDIEVKMVVNRYRYTFILSFRIKRRVDDNSTK